VFKFHLEESKEKAVPQEFSQPIAKPDVSLSATLQTSATTLYLDCQFVRSSLQLPRATVARFSCKFTFCQLKTVSLVSSVKSFTN